MMRFLLKMLIQFLGLFLKIFSRGKLALLIRSAIRDLNLKFMLVVNDIKALMSFYLADIIGEPLHLVYDFYYAT